MRYVVPEILLSIFSFGTGHAQNTVGLLTNDETLSQDGYTIFYPGGQQTVFMVDNCGRLVHQWSDTTYTSSHGIYLMDNGDLIRCGKSAGVLNPLMNAGGAGEMVDRRNWNGNLIWRFRYNSPQYRMHHDVAPLANGNVLIVAWELKTAAEAAQLGLDTTVYDQPTILPEHIIEIEPTGLTTANIVWEWHVWDHLVQDFDPLRPNYGVISASPRRVNINYHPTIDPDWLHVNAIDYNAQLDQILLCVPHFNEIWVIDHSTTTAEAATSSGGISGRGGDLLYRWGNPEAYGRGTAADQKLFFQHDARWLGPGLDPNDPDYGRIMVFNNRIGGTYSSVDIFDPPIDALGQYTLDNSDPFEPEDHSWRYTAPVPGDLFSTGLSGAHKLPNGNVLIGSGRQARIFEIDTTEQVVWEYIVPLESGQPVAQGTDLQLGTTFFRATKYPSDHPFLSTVTFPDDEYIELSPDTTFCGSITVAISEGTEERSRSFYPNPSSGHISLESEANELIQIWDLTGKVLITHRSQGGIEQLDLTALQPGAYVLRVGETWSSVLVRE